jgi:uncharacterized membrane protein YvbJ
MYCKTCGVMIPEGRDSCPSCGMRIVTEQQFFQPQTTQTYGYSPVMREENAKKRNRSIGIVLIIIGIILIPLVIITIYMPISWIICPAAGICLLAGIITVATNMSR